MLLNNFINTMYSEMKATTAAGVESVQVIDNIYIGSVAGDWYSEEPAEQFIFAPYRRGIAFGSGTTPPQKTDYKLENHITTGLTYSGDSTNQADRVTNWVQTVQNTSTAQITITEVGLFSKYDPSQRIPCYLLTRTVLDTPVVLQPNEVKTFTITIDYNKFIDGTIIQNS